MFVVRLVLYCDGWLFWLMCFAVLFPFRGFGFVVCVSSGGLRSCVSFVRWLALIGGYACCS